jgi:hypothetical protein
MRTYRRCGVRYATTAYARLACACHSRTWGAHATMEQGGLSEEELVPLPPLRSRLLLFLGLLCRGCRSTDLLVRVIAKNVTLSEHSWRWQQGAYSSTLVRLTCTIICGASDCMPLILAQTISHTPRVCHEGAHHAGEGGRVRTASAPLPPPRGRSGSCLSS